MIKKWLILIALVASIASCGIMSPRWWNWFVDTPTGSGGGGVTYHYLLIDGAGHYLLIDNVSHKLRIDGAS